MNTNMSALLQTFAMILQQTLLLWRTRGRLWLPLVALLSIAPFTLTIGWYSDKWDVALSVGIGGPLAVMVLPFWLFIFANLQTQNSPSLSQLVPQLHRRLVQLVLVGYLLVTTVFALVVSISVGHFWHLLGLFLLILPCYTVVLSSAWGTVALIAVAIALDQPGFSPLQWWWQTGPLTTATLLLLGSVAGAQTFRFLLRKGDAGHGQRHAETARFQKMMVEDQPGSLNWESMLQSTPWLQRINPDRLRLGWQLAARATGPASGAKQRLFAALPPHFHALGMVSNIAAALLAMGLLGVQPVTSPWSFMASQCTAALLVVMTLVLPPTFVWRTLAALHRSRREQQLLHLLPHMPNGAALNRRLLASLLGQFALVWLLSLAGGLYVNWLGLDTVTPNLAPVFSLLTLPCGLLFMRDYAKSLPPSPNFPLLPIMIALALGLGWKFLQMAWQPLALGYLIAAVGIPTLLVGIWRWQRMMRAPGAFPVGRLA